MALDFDLLALELDDRLPRERENAWSITEIADMLDIDVEVARRVLHHHRTYLGTNTWAVLAEGGRVSAYWLSADPDEIREYGTFRLNDAETRIRTLKKIAERGVVFTDGRSAEGKRARIVDRHLGRLIEDLEDIR